MKMVSDHRRPCPNQSYQFVAHAYFYFTVNHRFLRSFNVNHTFSGTQVHRSDPKKNKYTAALFYISESQCTKDKIAYKSIHKSTYLGDIDSV